MRNFKIRQTKTDSVDCFLIADVIRFGLFTETHLARGYPDPCAPGPFRESLSDSCADYKRQVVAVLDRVFLNYEKLFSMCSVKAQGLSQDLWHTRTMHRGRHQVAVYLAKSQQGPLGTEKARELKAAARQVYKVD